MAEHGWFNTGLTPVEPWRTATYIDYWEKKASGEPVPFDAGSEKRYRLFISKTTSTPGTVAGSELFLRSNITRFNRYLLQYTPEWHRNQQNDRDTTSTPFEDSMFQMAICSTKFMLAMLERWQRWCRKRERATTRDAFIEFTSELPLDTELSSQILERMHLFSRSFPWFYRPVEENASRYSAVSGGETMVKHHVPTVVSDDLDMSFDLDDLIHSSGDIF